MMCYRDITFCASGCQNFNCFRKWTDETNNAAREWWDHDPDNVPVAFADFSKSCPDYKPPK